MNSAIVLGGQTERSEESRVARIEPGTRDNFSKAVFYLRIPKKVTNPEYILVLLPGINADGSGLVKHQKWLQFAEETQAAMISCTFSASSSAGLLKTVAMELPYGCWLLTATTSPAM